MSLIGLPRILWTREANAGGDVSTNSWEVQIDPNLPVTNDRIAEVELVLLIVTAERYWRAGRPLASVPAVSSICR